MNVAVRTFRAEINIVRCWNLLPLGGRGCQNVEHAAILAAGSGADYLLIGVALKPTYLFVYPRILLIDIKTHKVVMAKAAQLESSWSDKNTTARTAEKLAKIVSDALNKIQAQNTISQ